MVAGRRLSHDDRVKVIILKEEGYSVEAIAKRVKCSHSAVSKTVKRHKETGSVDDRPRSGRPRLSTLRDDRELLRISLRNRMFTSTQLKREWNETSLISCSARTVRRRLDENGLFGRVARRKPLLTDRHRKIRLKWAKEHKNWSIEDWNRVIWSDESKFNLIGSDGRVYVRRRVGEEFISDCVQQTVKHGGGNVMMWGCVSGRGVGPLVQVEGRMNADYYIQLLSTHLRPYAQSLGPNFIFMDDNAPCHRARKVHTWMSSQRITFMEVWPPQSPDLNPIEHVWDMLGRLLDDKKPKNLKELKSRLVEEWGKISTTEIQKLIASMPERVQAVIAMKGGHTKY